MVKIFSKEFWDEDNSAQQRMLLGGALRGALNAERTGAGAGGLIGAVGLGAGQGLNRHASMQADAQQQALENQQAQQTAQMQQQRIQNENQRIVLEKQKVARELKMRQQSIDGFNAMMGGQPDGSMDMSLYDVDDQGTPTGRSQAFYDNIRQKFPAFRNLLPTQIDEALLAGRLNPGDPLKAVHEATRDIMKRDNWSMITDDEKMELGLDVDAQYKINAKDGNIVDVNGNRVSITMDDKAALERIKSDYRQRLEEIKGEQKTDQNLLISRRRVMEDVMKKMGVNARTATDLLPRLDTIIGALDRGVQTGPFSEWTLGLRGLLQEAGWLTQTESKTLRDQEILESGANYLIPRVRPEGSGQTSDLEYKSFARSIPGLAKSQQGNRIIAYTLKQMTKYKVEENRLLQEWEQNNPYTMKGFADFREERLGSIIPTFEGRNDIDGVSAAINLKNGTVFRDPSGEYVIMDDKTRKEYQDNLRKAGGG